MLRCLQVLHTDPAFIRTSQLKYTLRGLLPIGTPDWEAGVSPCSPCRCTRGGPMQSMQMHRWGQCTSRRGQEHRSEPGVRHVHSCTCVCSHPLAKGSLVEESGGRWSLCVW